MCPDTVYTAPVSVIVGMLQGLGKARGASEGSETHGPANVSAVVTKERNELDVALEQSVVDHGLVLLDRHGARGVDDDATSGAVGIDTIDGRQDELFLLGKEEQSKM